MREQRAQDEASRVAFEKATGMPMGEFVAQQAKAQVGLSELTRTAQERDFADRERARTELEARRAAFVKATGQTPEEAEVGEAKRQLDLSTQLSDRFQKALRGELPVDPTLERALGEEETGIREDVLRRTGPGGDLGDIGLRNIREFRKRAEELRHKARTGAISEAEQYGFALSPALLRIGGPRDVAAATSAGAPPSSAAALAIPGLFRGSVIESPPQLGDLARSYFADRSLRARAGELGYQGALQNVSLVSGANASRASFQAAQQQALINGMFQLGGAGIGAAAMI
mgnify:CR=1 FL=1